MVFPVLVTREHSPAAFLWVLFWDLTRVYLFENKICDSVMILMCSFVWFEQLGLRNYHSLKTCQFMYPEMIFICNHSSCVY